MKRFLGLMVAIVLFLPFVVSAKDKVDYKCTTSDEGVTYNCTVYVNLESEADQITLTLTEQGGADITSITDASASWNSVQEESNGVTTVTLTSSDLNPLQGEHDLINVTYTSSGTEDCRILLAFKDASITMEPDEPTTPSEPENPSTGSTIPYIALGVIALGAIGLYIGTKNKSKMYRI